MCNKKKNPTALQFMLKKSFYLHHKPALFLTAPYCPSAVLHSIKVRRI